MDSGLAKVTKIWPGAHKADIVMTRSGRRYPMVDISSHIVTTNSGRVEMHTPTPPEKPYGVEATGDRDILAYVQFFGGLPVIMGFKVPEVGEMTFLEPDLRVDRHSSDVYSTTDAAGNFEMAWPNGSYLRIGATPGLVDRTATDVDKQWKVKKNTGAALYAHFELRAGGSTVFDILVDPSGDATITAAGTITSSAAQWTHTGPMAVHGSLVVTGSVSATGSISTPGIVAGGTIESNGTVVNAP